MSCQRAFELMSLLMEEDATPDIEAELAEHLAVCAECESEWQAMQAVDQFFGAIEAVEPPPMLATQVMERVQQHERRRAIWRVGRLIVYGILIASAMITTPALLISALNENHPSVVSSFVSTLMGLATLLRTLVGAGEIILRAMLGGQYGMLLIGWVVLAALLTAGWLRLVALSRSSGMRT